MSVADEIRKLVELRDAGHLDSFEFERAKSRLLESDAEGVNFDSNPYAGVRRGSTRLRRSKSDRWIGGVCGGLAAFTGIESWIWRLLFFVAVFFAGFGLLPYVVLWIFMPSEKSS